MKIRISDQSLRIRLSEEEVQRLCEEEVISTTIQLNAIDSFKVELGVWHLKIGEVQTAKNSLLVSIPQTAAQSMLQEKGYIYSCEQEVTGNSALQLEVEIDLQKATHS
jgi:hypothetical protein